VLVGYSPLDPWASIYPVLDFFDGLDTRDCAFVDNTPKLIHIGY